MMKHITKLEDFEEYIKKTSHKHFWIKPDRDSKDWMFAKNLENNKMELLHRSFDGPLGITEGSKIIEHYKDHGERLIFENEELVPCFVVSWAVF